MARLDLWMVVRAGIVLLAMTFLVSGFSAVPGDDPIAGPREGAVQTPGAGVQISGEIISVRPGQSPPLVLLSTPRGQLYVILPDPALAASLRVGQRATFSGLYLTADVFNAFQIIDSPLAATTELTLGDPLSATDLYYATGGPAQGGTVGDPAGSTGPVLPQAGLPGASGALAPSASGGYVVYVVPTSPPVCSSDNDNASNDNETGCVTPTPTPTRTPTRTPKPTKTPTPGACSTDQRLSISPTSGSATVGRSYSVQVTLDSTGVCSGYRVYLEVDATSTNRSVGKVSATLDGSNRATLSYTGASSGKDTFRVWLDYSPDGQWQYPEPTTLGSVTWSGPTATPTATPTRTPTR